MFNLAILLICVQSAYGFFPKFSLRKSFASVAIPIILGLSSPVLAEDTPVYWGVGCFWHVQHEFVDTEKKVLGRSDTELTSLAGYAGGNSVGNKGRVCYHNLLGADEYGNLGHGEVVGMKLPSDKIGEFAKEYFSLFDSNGDRPDKGDRGPEYRSLLGVPGGMKSPYYNEILNAATARGIKLQEGKGNDKDTLGKNTVWVMDTDKFPFYQAEVYHQFHDGFMLGEQYPESYNSIRTAKVQSGVLSTTGCPDKI